MCYFLVLLYCVTILYCVTSLCYYIVYYSVLFPCVIILCYFLVLLHFHEKTNFTSHKQYSNTLYPFFYRNTKETHTDQSILYIVCFYTYTLYFSMFLLSLKRKNSKALKRGSSKKSFLHSVCYR